MKKLSVEVRNYMKELMDKGKTKPEIVKDTAFKFPKLSKNMIAGEYADVKEEYITKSKVEETSKEIKKEAKKLAKEIAGNLEKEIEKGDHITDTSKMIEGFEVLEEKVVKEIKVKSLNGIYEAKTNVGVALESEGYKIAFRNVEELESFCSEFKKVFGMI